MVDRLNALSAQVEVSSESESVCNSGGQKRDRRTRERGTGGHRGYFRHPATQPALYNDPSPPPLGIRVSLSQITATPLENTPIFAPIPSNPENPSQLQILALRSQI